MADSEWRPILAADERPGRIDAAHPNGKRSGSCPAPHVQLYDSPRSMGQDSVTRYRAM